MCAAKSAAKSLFARSFDWLLGPGRPALIVVLLLGMFGGGWYLAWRRISSRVLAGSEYRVGPAQVEITPQPEWIRSDIKAEAFCDPTIDGPLSLMDDDLLDRIKKAFEGRPWVARVTRVTKHHPASVKIEIVYRKPVCMVEVSGGLIAVDAEGVLLPSDDFSPVEASRYPRLLGMDRNPISPAGRRWNDSRVIGAAEIAAAFGAAWENMRLKHILSQPTDAVTAATDAGNRRASEPVFVLVTLGGSRVTWGYAPGANMLGEPTAAEKVARLQRYFLEHDSLDGPQGKAQELDVRTLSKSAPL